MFLQLTSQLQKQISDCLGAYVFQSLDFLRSESWLQLHYTLASWFVFQNCIALALGTILK